MKKPEPTARGAYVGEPDLARKLGWAHGHPAMERVAGWVDVARRQDERAYASRRPE